MANAQAALRPYVCPFVRLYRDHQTRIHILERAVEVLLDDNPQPNWVGAAFNGQECRRRMFHNILDTLPIAEIVETGTCVGDTTGYMSEKYTLPIRSCEAMPIVYLTVKKRMAQFSNVHVYKADSRPFLKQRASDGAADGVTFFYLDAHWYEDLPLADELSVSAENWPEFVMMIDNFRVSNDNGYGFDYYGPGKGLDLRTFGAHFKAPGLDIFFPALPSAKETGAKRGSVVLARKGATSHMLKALTSLGVYEG